MSLSPEPTRYQPDALHRPLNERIIIRGILALAGATIVVDFYLVSQFGFPPTGLLFWLG